MARVTVEDCEKLVENRFDLVVLAAQRTRQIISGEALTIEKKDDKNPVIALREIAAETVSLDKLKEDVINSFRAYVESDDSDEDDEMLEEDTYNPYVGLELQSLESSGESENVNIVTDDEFYEGDDDLKDDPLDDESLDDDSFNEDFNDDIASEDDLES